MVFHELREDVLSEGSSSRASRPVTKRADMPGPGYLDAASAGFSGASKR